MQINVKSQLLLLKIL